MSKIRVFELLPLSSFLKIAGFLLKTTQCDYIEVILAKFEKKLIGRSLDRCTRLFSTIFGPGEAA